LNFCFLECTVTMQETYADSCCEGHRRARTQNGRRTFEEAPGQYDDRPSAATSSGFRTLDIRTDRLLSSWLREVGVPDGALKANEPAPDFLLPEANGKLVLSLELRQTAPLIVTFVYGTWSPLCAAGLRALHGATPSIRAAGARAIAITPETGDLPRKFKRDHRLDLEILSDLDLGVSLSFGLVSVVPAEIKSRLLQRGLDLSAPYGFAFWMLPMPATYVLDQRGIIRRAWVGPASITGTMTEAVLAALSELDGREPRP
jgi:peroxiredoxin